MVITELTIQNVKRITAVSFRPEGNAIIVGGKNGAGKSSVLDSIMYALAGGRELPKVPIRKGASKASVEAKLSAEDGKPPLLVRRVFTPKNSRIEVTYVGDAEARLKNPQSILDTLCSRVAFDPLSFVRAKPSDQADQLRRLVGIDTTALEAERAQIYEDRRLANKALAGVLRRLEVAQYYPDVPAETMNVSELTDHLLNIQAQNAQKAEAGREVINAERKVSEIESRRDDAVRLVNHRQRQLNEAKMAVAELDTDLGTAMKAAKVQRETYENMPESDTSQVESDIRNAESINAKIRANKERDELQMEVDAWKRKTTDLSQGIEALDEKKRNLFETAKWPVDGLGFADDGVTLNGLPFSQASQAEQLRISIAMGFAANPKLKVILIRDSSLLDEDNMKTVTEMAREYDGQVWLERVGDGKECSVVIDEGKLRETDKATG